MYRSPLYEIVHDYAILGEESQEQSMQYSETIQSFHYVQDTGQQHPNSRIEKNSSKSKTLLQQTENNVFLTKNILGKKFSLDNVKRKTEFNSQNIHKHNQTQTLLIKQQHSQLLKLNDNSKPLSKLTEFHLPLSNRSEPKRKQPGLQTIINYFSRKNSQVKQTPDLFITGKSNFNNKYSINNISQKQNTQSPINQGSQQFIYNRSLNWLNQVKERVAQQQEKNWQEQIKKCPFKPQLSKSNSCHQQQRQQKDQKRIRSAFNSLSPIDHQIITKQKYNANKLSLKKNLKMKSGKENTYIQIFKDQKTLHKFDKKQIKIKENNT